MVVDERLLLFIKKIRETYGHIGKEKLKILLAAYARSLGIPPYGATKIGKIIRRYHYFFDRRQKHHLTSFSRLKMKRSPKGPTPGYLEMDSIHIQVNNNRLVFITLIDVATRIAYAERVPSATSLSATGVLQRFQAQSLLKVHTVQTDNGSEFLGSFHQYLEKCQIPHYFSYPRSPKINGFIERFNRTLQEEFVERCDAWWYDNDLGGSKLTHYLEWYNGVRPHYALKYRPPLAYLKQQP
jgi:transposase InsO family protein